MTAKQMLSKFKFDSDCCHIEMMADVDDKLKPYFFCPKCKQKYDFQINFFPKDVRVIKNVNEN